MHFGLKAYIDFKFSAKGQSVIENETWGAVRLHQDTQIVLNLMDPALVFKDEYRLCAPAVRSYSPS